MGIITGDNKYAGGLSYSSPSFSLSGGGASVNGGFSFDLPLATVAAFNDQALGAISANSSANRAFLDKQYADSGTRVDTSSARSFEFLNNGMNRVAAANTEATDATKHVNNLNQQNSLFRAIFAPKPAKGGKSCFITTAICELSGKPDDCYELTTLRKFRDEYMLPNRVRAGMVSEYYAKAPGIVAAIKSLPDGGRAMLQMLERQYLLPAIAHVEKGENAEAMDVYLHMVAMADTLISEVA